MARTVEGRKDDLVTGKRLDDSSPHVLRITEHWTEKESDSEAKVELAMVREWALPRTDKNGKNK